MSAGGGAEGARPALGAGADVGPYRVQALLGTGGMSRVYRATRAGGPGPVALKVLAPELFLDPEWTSRFKAEVEVLRRIDHPNVVRVIELVQHQRGAAIAMELIEGHTLARVLKTGPLGAGLSLEVARQLASALAAVHAAGVIHRDLKPQNVLVVGALDGEGGPPLQVKLLDFGIAKHDLQGEHHTRTGLLLGTPAYMAPEQIVGAALSPATDLYALAELIIEMLSGKRLFRGHRIDILRRKLTRTPEFTLPLNLSRGPELAQLLGRCLSPKADRRPALAELSDFLDTLAVDTPDEEADTERTPVDLGELDDTTIDTDPSPPDLTQALLDQILSDFAEAPEPERRPKPRAPSREEPLELLRPEERELYWPMPASPTGREVASPEAKPVVAPRLPRAPAAAPAVVLIPSPAPERRPWLLPVSIGAGILLLLAIGTVWRVPLSAPEVEPPAEERPPSLSDPHAPARNKLARLRERWRPRAPREAPAVTVLLATADELCQRDDPGAYRTALDVVQTALVHGGDDPELMAALVELELLLRPEREPLELVDLNELLAYAAALKDGGPRLLRARVRLALSAGGSAAALAPTLGGRPQDILLAAELKLEADPERSLALLADPALEPWWRRQRIRARALAALGRYKSAISELEGRLDGGDAELLFGLGLLYQEVGLPERALPAFKAALSRPGTVHAARWELARLSTATASLRELARDEEPPKLRRRALLELLRRTEGAADDERPALLRAARAAGADAAQLSVLEADEALARGDLAAAQTALGGLAPGPEAALRLAVLDLLRGKTDGAVLRLPDDGADPRVLAVVGAGRWRAQDAADAARLVDVLAARDPDQVEDDRRLVELPPRWLELLAADLKPHSRPGSEGATLRAVLLSLAGRPTEAASALGTRSTQAAAALYRARADRTAGHLAAAERELRAAIKRWPRVPMLRAELARTLTLTRGAATAARVWRDLGQELPAGSPASVDRLSAEVSAGRISRDELQRAMPELVHSRRARRLAYEVGL